MTGQGNQQYTCLACGHGFETPYMAPLPEGDTPCCPRCYTSEIIKTISRK